MANEQEDILVSVDVDTGEATSNVDKLNNKLNNLGSNAGKSFQGFKKEIREATLEAQKLEQEFGAMSQEAKNARDKVAALKDEYNEFNARVQASNPDNKFAALGSLTQGFAGSLQAAAGGMALFGSNTDAVNEQLTKLQGLINLTQALDSIDDIKNSFKNLGSVLGLTTAATKAQSTAVVENTAAQETNVAVTATNNTTTAASTTITEANAAATTVQTEAIVAETAATETATAATISWTAALLANPITLLVALVVELVVIMVKLGDTSLDTAGKIAVLNSALETNQHLLEADMESIKRNTDLQTARAKAAGASDADLIKIQKDGVQKRIDAREEERKNVLAHYNDIDRDDEKFNETRKKYDDELFKLEQADREDRNQLQVKDYEIQTAINKKLEEDQKKAEELRKQHNEKIKQLLNQEKQNYEAILKEVAALDKKLSDDLAKIGMNDHDKALKDIENAQRDQKDLLTKAASERNKLLDDELKYGKITQKQHDDEILKSDQSFNDTKDKIDKDAQAKTDELNKKYNEEYEQFIKDHGTTVVDIYTKQKDDINKAIDDAIKKYPEKKAELEKAKADLIGNVDTQKDLQTSVTNTETNVIKAETVVKNVGKNDFDAQRDAQEQLYQAKVDQENAQFDQDKERLAGNQAELEKLNAQHQANLTDLNKENADARKEIDKNELLAKVDNLDKIGQAATAASQLFAENTVASKGLAVAGATIDTIRGTVAAYTAGLEAFPAPYNLVAAAAFAAISAASGLAQIKKIVSVKVPGAKGGDAGSFGAAGNVTPPAAPSITSTQLTPTQTQDVNVVNQVNQAPLRAYVVQEDLNTQKQKSDFVNSVASF